MGTSTNHNVYAQDTQGQAHIGSTRKRSHRGGNFTVEEDNQLVSAWLNISLDVIQGNDQRATQLWNRIYEYFNKYKKPFSPERSVASLTNRWSTIQKSTKKFCRFLFQIESMHPSGVDEQDKIQKAKNMYRENQKATFQFDHCWYLLRHQPKWQTHMDQLRSRRKSKNITHSPDTTLESIHLGEDHCSEEVFVDLERPHGTKAEKEEKKRKAHETSLVEMLSELKEERKILNEERREALRIAEEDRQELLRIKKRKLELEIMLIDKRKLSPMQQQYIHERQLEILAKYRTTLS
ncbi:glutathione S-transferase T2-like [Carya illinoinensis]|nr:glutathione S-transferase T2-like [Carya illinoinensis]